MYIERYLEDITGGGTVSEIALYTPLAIHILRGLLRYPANCCLINKRNQSGIPDVRLLSTADQSEWIVCEAKLKDSAIRNETQRRKLWQEQVVEKQYISAETVYILLCAPYTFRVYDIRGELVAGADVEPERRMFRDCRTQQEHPLTDEALKQALEVISAQASFGLPQYEAFRNGELEGGYISLSHDTISLLQPVFEFGLRELKGYSKSRFDALREDYESARTEQAKAAQQLMDAGADATMLSRARNRQRAVKRKYRVALQLFEEDYPQFQHDQAYAGTDQEKHFEDIFLTNTAYIALTRLFFVRICEDISLTTRKVSNEGPGVWGRFVQHIRHQYQDLLDVAYKDASQVYSRLFETTVFDWYGLGNGRLNEMFERILFRLNAFSFQTIDRDLLGTVYQYFRPKAERKRLGEYYTPEEVVDYILARAGFAQDAAILTRRLLDPACGSFTFGVRALLPLLKAGDHLTARNKIELARRALTGRDINPFSVFLSHLSLLFSTLDIYRQAKEEDPEFRIQGFDVANVNSLLRESGQAELTGAEEAEREGISGQAFDYVVGNPPFVRNERIPQEDRAILEANFPHLRAGNTDLAAYFLDCALSSWLKPGGVLGMVAPIGQASAKNAAPLRARLTGYTVTEIVSLEWMAKEIFPDADIIPMLLFVRKADPSPDHRVSVVMGLKTKAELTAATHPGEFRAAHVSEIAYADWLRISPTGDWPLDVTARDMPILQKLSEGPRLSTAAEAMYGIKLGSVGNKLVQAHGTESETILFAKGQDICAFGMSQPEEAINPKNISKASDPGIWRDLAFYKLNQGKFNQTGLDGTTFASNSLLVETLPSDTLCCFVPQVYTTLIAAVVDPLQAAINNSSIVVVPHQCSAHLLAAVINSRVCRYFAFLTMRAAILLRRRSTWYPRALKNLPWPDFDAETALRVHEWAKEAASLSEKAQRTEAGVFLDGMSEARQQIGAGLLGVDWTGTDRPLDSDDLAAAIPAGNALACGEGILRAADADTLLLARAAALASGKEEFDRHALQNLLLPERAEDRRRIAASLREIVEGAEAVRTRMETISEEIDACVAAALKLSAAEHEVIRQRCEEFPLNVTVGRPRYVWNPDRKTQARRVYEEGQRFRQA